MSLLCQPILVVPTINDKYFNQVFLQDRRGTFRAKCCLETVLNVTYQDKPFYAIVYNAFVDPCFDVLFSINGPLFGIFGIEIDTESEDHTYGRMKNNFNAEFSNRFTDWYSVDENSPNGWPMIAFGYDREKRKLAVSHGLFLYISSSDVVSISLNYLLGSF